MFKLKSLNSTIFIIKFVFICVMLLPFIWFSYSFEIAPLNALSQWVDKVEKNIDISKMQWKAIVDNLYSKALEQAQYWEIEPLLNSVKKATVDLNETFLCNLRDNDVLNILYNSNDEFRKNIKTISVNFKRPVKDDMVQWCSKLIACISNNSGATKIKDSLSYCKSVVGSYYINQYQNNYSLYSLSSDNKWSDAFWNNSLDDSSYDILSDIYVLAKILFDEPKEASEVLFYEFPNLTTQNRWWDDVQSSVIVNWYSPYYDDVSGPENENTWDDSWEWSWDWWDWNPQNDWLWWDVNWNIDDDFNGFVGETTYVLEGKEWYSFLWNSCISWFEIPWYSGYSYTVLITWEDSWYFVNLPHQVQSIIDNIDSFSCNHNGICEESFESATCADCTHTPPEEDSPELSWLLNHVLLTWLNAQTLSCFSSCSDIPCTATSCDRLVCYAKCLCLTYESPYYDPVENPWLWALFKLKFCVIPVVEHKVVTTKKVSNLASVFNEINNVVQNLRDSGQLMLNKKTKEFLEAGFSNNNFAKQISFSIDWYEKIPSQKWSEKQEKEDQLNLNTMMMENILWFEEKRTLEWNWRNKYIVKWGMIQENTVIDTTQSTNDSLYWLAEPSELVSSLQVGHLSSMWSQLSEFLESNLNFWISTKDVFESLNITAKSLLDKKDN